MATVGEIANWLESFAPLYLAAEWDNVGLILGDRATEVSRVLTCLTITAAVVEEAVADGVNLIVTHHPLLFRGTKTITSDTSEGKLLLPLLRHGIAVYSPHTAFDNCVGGINDGLAAKLGLQNVTPLRPRFGRKECKLVVFVPEADLGRVSEALFQHGAGRIGNYEQCSFQFKGTGTFFGGDASTPSIGEKGRRETVEETRLEVIVPEMNLDAALRAMRAAHSYEEPAYDVYSLAPKPAGGEGRMGSLTTPQSLGTIAASLKAVLNAGTMQIVGEAAKPVKRIAVACGAAGEFLKDAIREGADAFVTGEVRFHEALAAEAAGVALILPGHYPSERPAVEDLAAQLAEAFTDITVWPSRSERDPLRGGD